MVVRPSCFLSVLSRSLSLSCDRSVGVVHEVTTHVLERVPPGE